MTIQDETIQHVISANKTKKFNKEKIQNELDDCLECLTILDNAIESTYFDDKHSLIMQSWCKEYKTRLNNLREQLKDNNG
jgi:hypothetical protein